MSTPTLVLDTNVVVSALRSSAGASHRLIQLVDQGLFEVGLTAPLVLEYEAVCKRLFGSTVSVYGSRVTAVQSGLGIVTALEPLWPPGTQVDAPVLMGTTPGLWGQLPARVSRLGLAPPDKTAEFVGVSDEWH
jgi:hypothetical protein